MSKQELIRLLEKLPPRVRIELLEEVKRQREQKK